MNFPFSDAYPFASQTQILSGGGTSDLPDGVYWQSGNASSKPPTTGQGWISTSNLTDGLAGNTSSRETSSGDTISVLDVRTAFAISSWPVTARWKGTISQGYFEWNGSAWSTIFNSGPSVLNHDNYIDDTLPGSFLGGTTSTKQHLIVFTESDTTNGNMSVSDQRPS